MKLFAEFLHRNHKTYYLVELHYSCLHWISGNYPYYVRIWPKGWLDVPYRHSYCGESFGKSKFDAYRLALKDFNDKNLYLWNKSRDGGN